MNETETNKPSPLVAAAQGARGSMHILLDYVKVAADIHSPDEYRPAIHAIENLSLAIRDIENLQEGIGESGCLHVGHISAE